MLPTGTAQVVINLAEDRTRGYDESRGFASASLPVRCSCGPSTRYGIIDTDEQYDVVGACIAPGGLPSLLAPRAAEFAETDVPLDALWGTRAIDRLRSRLLEARTPDARLDVLEAALIATNGAATRCIPPSRARSTRSRAARPSRRWATPSPPQASARVT